MRHSGRDGRRWRTARAGWMLILLAGAAVQAQAAIDEGVSRALAQERAARVRSVQYQLTFALHPHQDVIPGTELLTFTLGPADSGKDFAMDFRGGPVQSMAVNDTAMEAVSIQGHLILPARLLHAGVNHVSIAFSAKAGAAGAAITPFEDKDDGSEYLYSLFVPMDASMAFPCFDQPDLKARFSLVLTAPKAWTVVANTKPAVEEMGDEKRWSFPETKPISTYLFAFTAGPWAKLAGGHGEPDLYVRASQLSKAKTEAPAVQALTAAGVRWYEQYFAQPYPFPKYDLVLIPGFAFGGMEHAGETFLKEETVLFRVAPTATDRFNRDITVLHELAHQWFGDLVTMRWFDDLWLKEGFAQYMAYKCMAALHPESRPWKHFFESIKPAAYGIDETEGTTPIYQDVPNLKDAKSAYGAIVYQKAPSILKQLEFRLGSDGFRDGLRLYLREHAYGNATWSDLIDALHRASGQDVRGWADAWVLRRGMPEVSVGWTCADGRLKSLTLAQKDVLPDGYVWPMANKVLLAGGRDATPTTLRVNWAEATVKVEEATGKPCPAYVFANAGDEGYGRFLVDERTRSYLQGALPREAERFDPLLRSMLWSALWDQVHTVRWAPREFVGMTLENLPREQDIDIAQAQGLRSVTAMHRYMTPAARGPLVARMEQVATMRMNGATDRDLALTFFRLLSESAETAQARATLKEMLAGTVRVPGVELRPLDRWTLVGRLMVAGDADAPQLLAEEQKRDASGDGQKFAWAIAAGAPNAGTKAKYFAAYQAVPGSAGVKPEDWLTQSLPWFNAWNQAELTAPYLRPALDQLPEIKQDRKIFFLGAWLGSFLDGQVSGTSLDEVREWAAQPGIDPDLRRKVIENSDELERTVRIRKAFPE